MSLRPLKDILHVKPEADEYEGTLVIPESIKEDEAMVRGTVVNVGPDVEHIKVGDKVLHTKWTGNEFEHDGQQFKAMHEEDVLAVVE